METAIDAPKELRKIPALVERFDAGLLPWAIAHDGAARKLPCTDSFVRRKASKEACAMRESAAGMRGVSLRDVLPDASAAPGGDLRVVSCADDSRQCRPGDLFVALVGVERDGHDFAEEAIAQGASAVLAERPLPHLRVPVWMVDDTRRAYGTLCQALVGNPAERLKVIGITGTNGKTTTSFLLASVLEAAGYRAGIIGTLGHFDGHELVGSSLTTPAAPQLAQLLARMEANGCSHVVAEVTSHALCLGRLSGLPLDMACLTNVRHDHLDFHGTIERYRAAKARIFDCLRPEGIAVLNIDDPATRTMADQVPGPALGVGVDSPAEITGVPLESLISEQTFLLCVGDDSIPVRTSLVGRHNLENCLVAAAAGVSYGIDLPTIVRGLEAVARIPGRLERLECGQPFGVFVDFAHTADALAGVLQTLRKLTTGRLICVFGAGGDRDKFKRPRMGAVVDRLADIAVVTSDNPRHEDPAEIIDNILGGFRVGSEPRVIADRASAIRFALAQARPGDCVLVAGKGHERFQIVGDRLVPFDDRVVAEDWLYSNNSPQFTRRAA